MRKLTLLVCVFIATSCTNSEKDAKLDYSSANTFISDETRVLNNLTWDYYQAPLLVNYNFQYQMFGTPFIPHPINSY